MENLHSKPSQPGPWQLATPRLSLRLLSTALAALGLSAFLAASPAQTSRSPKPGVPIALTGCLQASSEPRVFLLTNAIRADDDADQGDTDDAKPASASGAAAAKNEGRTYRIVPLGAQVDLKSHVGERVDVGGRVVTMDSLHGASPKTDSGATPDADAPGSGTGAAAGAGAGAGKDKQASSRLDKGVPPTIAVTYVRKVAATCTSSDAKP